MKKTILCPSCKGYGKNKYTRDSRPCSTCSGSGTVEISPSGFAVAVVMLGITAIWIYAIVHLIVQIHAKFGH